MIYAIILNFAIAGLTGYITGQVVKCIKGSTWCMCAGLLGSIFGLLLLCAYGITNKSVFGSVVSSGLVAFITIMICKIVTE